MPAADPAAPTLVVRVEDGKVWVTQVAPALAKVVTSAGHWLVLVLTA